MSTLARYRPPGGLSETQFEAIATLVQRDAGIVMAENKVAMVQSRLVKRLRALRLATFDEYLELVASVDGEEERRELISALTTNVSQFFREDHHFETLRKEVLPELLRRARAGERVRIWSAGCSNGQEPYTIAMVLTELEPSAASLDIKILATDIDPKVIAFASAANYPTALLTGLSPERRARHVEQIESGGRIKSSLKELVVFRELNLLHKWPLSRKVDAIFCRNVVIYFDETTQSQLWPRFAAALHPNGWFFVGHSERIPKASALGFTRAGITTYRLSGQNRSHEKDV